MNSTVALLPFLQNPQAENADEFFSCLENSIEALASIIACCSIPTLSCMNTIEERTRMFCCFRPMREVRITEFVTECLTCCAHPQVRDFVFSQI